MKKIFFIAILFIGVFGYGQRFRDGHVDVPKTTTEINAIVGPEEGETQANSTTGTIWLYINGGWVDTGTGGGLSSADIDTFAELDAIVADESLAKVGDFVDLSSAQIVTSGFKSFNGNIFSPQYYFGYSDGTSGRRWRMVQNNISNLIRFDYQDVASTDPDSGSFTTIYTMDPSGTPSAATDLIDKAYADANYGGGDLWSDPVDSDIVPDTNNTYDIGSLTNRFLNFYGNVLDFTTGSASSLSLTGSIGIGTFADFSPTDTEPASQKGNVYFDDSESTLKQYNGTSWEPLNGGGLSLPVDDTTALVQDPVDNTKQVRIDAENVGTGSTAILNIGGDNEFVDNLNVESSGTGTFDFKEGASTRARIQYNATGNQFGFQNLVSSQNLIMYDAGGAEFTTDLTADSFIKDGATSSDVLLGDGTTSDKLIESDTTSLGSTAYKPISNLIIHDYSVSATDPTLGTNEYALQINGPSEEKSFVIKWGAVGADIATGTGLEFVAVHDAITITRVEAYLDTAPTGSVATFDINEDGTSILSTKLTIDASENWSDTAATAAVISDTAINALSKLSIDVDGVGSTVAGADPQITIYYTIDP